MNKERLELIKESLEEILFEMKIGKKVEFTPHDGINMSLMLETTKQQQEQIERYEKALKAIVNVDAMFLEREYNVEEAHDEMDRVAKQALEES